MLNITNFKKRIEIVIIVNHPSHFLRALHPPHLLAWIAWIEALPLRYTPLPRLPAEGA
jgi:hypothetical protein